MSLRSVIRGSGSALPVRAVSNAEMTTMVETTDEWIVPKLKGQTGELGFIVDDRLDWLAIAILAMHRRNVDRAWEIIDDAIKETLDALLLEG